MSHGKAARVLVWLGVAGLVSSLGAAGWQIHARHRAHQSQRKASLTKEDAIGRMLPVPGAPSWSLRAFDIDVHEVTVAAYRDCVDTGACSEPSPGPHCNYAAGKSKHPVNCVDQQQAAAFCAWAGRRLPTAREWQLAACGLSSDSYPWGEESAEGRACINRDVSVGDGAKARWRTLGTCPSGGHPRDKSEVGAMDLAGNVMEWTADDAGGYRVVRGSGWAMSTRGSDAPNCSNHAQLSPRYRSSLVGFRCARDGERSLATVARESLGL